MKNKYHYLTFSVLIIFTCLNCNNEKTVSKNELMNITNHWEEPKVAIWYYMGTKDNYNYFAFYDLGLFNTKYYKVNKNELTIDEPFLFTNERKKWKVMPWGPHKKIR